MMAKAGVIFSEGDAGRIARAVKTVERLPGAAAAGRSRKSGQAAALWAELTSQFSGGAANTVKAYPCEAGGENAIYAIELVLYVELPITGEPDRSCFSAGDVVGYMPYEFTDATGAIIAHGFLLDPVRVDNEGGGGGEDCDLSTSGLVGDNIWIEVVLP